jgi:hypothetical protein
VIAKTPFAKGILPPKEVTIVRPPSGNSKAEPNEYWLLLRMLYGLHCSPRHWYEKINKILLSIGLTLLLKIRVSSPALFKTPTNLMVMFLTSHSLLASTLMTSFTFQRIQTSRNCSVAFSASIARWISWVLLSGFLVFTSCGTYLHPWSLFT